MRQLKNFMRSRQTMRGCTPCECQTLQCWREATCECVGPYNPKKEASIQEIIDFALNTFKASPIYLDVDTADKADLIATVTSGLETAGEALRPYYEAVQNGNTFEKYIEDNQLTVDENGTCDKTMVDEDIFTLYVMAMGLIDCKYLAVDNNDEAINATELANYLDTIE